VATSHGPLVVPSAPQGLRPWEGAYWGKPCHHFLYSGGAFARLYPV